MNLEEILKSDDVVKSINNNKDYLFKLIPELEYLQIEQDNPQHHLDAWNHTLLALSLSENNFDIRLALLLHDIGKKECKKKGNDGFSHYWNHPKVSARISREILKRLLYDDDYIEYICKLIENHDTKMSDTQIFNDGNYEMCEILYKIQCCDALAHHPDHLEKRKEYLEKTRELLNQYGRTYGKNRSHK